MEFKDFISLVEKVEKENPILFELNSDRIASDCGKITHRKTDP